MGSLANAVVMAGPTIETGYPFSDLLRLAAVLVPGIIVIAMSLVIIFKYSRVYLLDLKLAKAQGRKSNWRGLLPIHVAAISISHAGLVLMLMTSVVDRFREPLYSTPRTVIYSVLLWMSVAALRIMTAHSKRRSVEIRKVTYPRGMGPYAGPEALGHEKGDPGHP